jgi:hypothetical protein
MKNKTFKERNRQQVKECRASMTQYERARVHEQDAAQHVARRESITQDERARVREIYA